MGAVVDHDLGTELGQIFNNGLADATIAAGDDGDFALEKVGKSLAFEWIGASQGNAANSLP